MNYFANDVGPSSYAAAATYGWQHSEPVVRHTGVVFQRSEIGLGAIPDGTTHTYLFGEKYHDPDNYETGIAGNDDQSMYNGHDQDNLRSTYVSFPPMVDRAGLNSEYSFGSAHPTGWLAVMCDGSVQLIDYSLELEIHRLRGNREDGRPVPGP